MKKKYIIPALQVVKVETQQMIAATTLPIGGTTDVVEAKGTSFNWYELNEEVETPIITSEEDEWDDFEEEEDL